MDNNDFKSLLRDNFEFFASKVFRDLHDREKLGKQAYIEYLCAELEDLAVGNTNRLVINLPPRHLKTFLGSVCLAAWCLGRDPCLKILVVTYADNLAQDISYNIRRVLRLPWYKEVFGTRLAEDRGKVNDFATTQGGGVYAASAAGSITGRGGDLIIFDDPLSIDDAENREQIERVNKRFDKVIMSRLNNPKTGKVVIIAHRLNADDLSGHVHKQGGWRRICLPMIAPRKRSYGVNGVTWCRKKGSLLRPGAFTRSQMKKLETTPDFETLYQQNPAGRQTLRIKAQHFLRFSPASLPPLPIVLSIDPGHRGGEGRSYSVIQAWGKSDDRFFLFDQWREQCRFDKLRQEYWAFVRKHRPVTALIEATANGPALIADARRRPSVNVVPVSPDGTSKIERFREQAGLIRKGRICLPEGALWIGDFITELVEFPSAGFDDQVDATTQYLGWMAGNPSLTLPPPRAVSVGRTFSGLITAKTPASANTQISGCVLGLRYRK